MGKELKSALSTLFNFNGVSAAYRPRVELEQIKFAAHEKFKDRRKLIQDYCDKNSHDKELQEVNNDDKWNKDLWFDYKHKLLFCQISKISSSTWISSLMS